MIHWITHFSGQISFSNEKYALTFRNLSWNSTLLLLLSKNSSYNFDLQKRVRGPWKTNVKIDKEELKDRSIHGL